MTKTKLKVSDAAGSFKPYVERAIRDEELRDSVRSAYESARTIYDELIGGRGVTKVATRVATDKDLQDELRSAVADLRTAADRIQGKRTSSDDHTGKASLLLFLGIALGVLFNPFTGPQTRKLIADKLFGGGDDFTYQGNNGSS